MTMGLFFAFLWSPLFFILLYFIVLEKIPHKGSAQRSFVTKALWPLLTLCFYYILVIDPMPHFFGLPGFLLMALITACYVRGTIELLRLLQKGYAKKRIVLALCLWGISIIPYSYMAFVSVRHGGLTWP
ncbi:hypothetical protein GFB49_03435 [Epibacterium sp. SM1979]|uniref:Uncharacterized protein n=1 Tax=Tritonibacter litoralis TaxID=2662264 RepID=A0A843Y9A9_9RHOB|nr:hypothetical protein [Tritonibacter litoralis]MQQ07496.1 hypothetical protein [Tritonibacter litoralis]